MLISGIEGVNHTSSYMVCACIILSRAILSVKTKLEAVAKKSKQSEIVYFCVYGNRMHLLEAFVQQQQVIQELAACLKTHMEDNTVQEDMQELWWVGNASMLPI